MAIVHAKVGNILLCFCRKNKDTVPSAIKYAAFFFINLEPFSLVLMPEIIDHAIPVFGLVKKKKISASVSINCKEYHYCSHINYKTCY